MELVRLGVVGAGSFGTAMVQCLRLPTLVWCRDETVAESLNQDQRNRKHFPEVLLEGDIEATCQVEPVRRCRMIFICVPATAVREVCELIGSEYNGTLVICSKGVEESGKLMPEVTEETNPGAKVAILSGPNFAQDLVVNRPCITTIATKAQVQFDVFKENLKVHPSSDVAGVAVCGVFKNVLALACGLAHGAEINLTTQAAVVLRGFQEMEQLLVRKSGKVETLHSPAGLGDLWLTTLGSNSRNYKVGINLVRGRDYGGMLAEGLLSISALAQDSMFCASLWHTVQKIQQTSSLNKRKAMVEQELLTL